MSQLKLELREPSPSDYRRLSQVEKPKHELSGDVKTSELSEEEVGKLYKRASDVNEKEDDEKEFFQREKSVKPPKKGEIVKESFPPPLKLEKPEELLKEEEEIRKELKVIRYMPEGRDIDVVPQVVVTFNQPMIPLTSVDDIKKYPVPVNISPPIEGEWRWVGTKTVKWKPIHRLPKSTDFTVIVPEGVKSEWGCETREEFSWGFSTIPVKFTRITPCSSISRQNVGKDSPVIIEFNQKINQEEILKIIRVSNISGSIIPMNLEELKEFIDSGDMKKKLPIVYNAFDSRIRNVLPDQWVCFRFEQPLLLSTKFKVTIPKGCSSKEGPRLTEFDQSKSFSTYGPFHKSDHHPKKDIVPNQSWSISFSNNIELEEFDPVRDISIDPPLPQVKIIPSGNNLRIHGQSKGNTRYMVTLKKTMTDIYGQCLNEETVMFSVGRAKQNMYGFFNNQMIVHDMCLSKEPEFEVVSINLSKIRVCVYQVDPMEYHKSFLGSDYTYYRRKWGHQNPRTLEQRINCGKIVFDKVLNVPDKPDELVVTTIPLTKHLQNVDKKCGQLVVYVEPDKNSWKEGEWRYCPKVLTWIQVTHLAVDAVSSHGGEVYGFCTSLEDGRPSGEVRFHFIPPVFNTVAKYEDKTIAKIGDDDGTVFISHGTSSSSSILMVEKGGDIAFVTNLRHIKRVNDRILSYIVNDRNLYKPNETVSIKGIFRLLRHDQWKRKLLLPDVDTNVHWICYDPRGSKLKEGDVKLNRFGSFFVEIELPDNINLGDGRVNFTLFGENYTHTFKIQEFRTPEFKSSLKVDKIPYFPNGVAIVEGKAEYFSGGGLSGCDVTWKVNQNVTTYYPPSFTFRGFSFDCGYSSLDESNKRGDSLIPFHDPFTFFGEGGGGWIGGGGGPGKGKGEKKLEGITDGSGEHKCCIDFNSNDEIKIKKPTNVSIDLNIRDINRQVMSSSTSFTVHPSRYYVGIKKKKYFARKGDAFPLDLVVSDLEGTLIQNVDIEMTIYNRYWERKGYTWNQKEIEVGKGKFNSKKEPIHVDIKLEMGGTFFFVCRIIDPEGRENYCSTSVWVAGGKEKVSGGSKVEEEVAKLIGNKNEYETGDEAKILVSSPFSPAEGLMVVLCNGFVEKQRFRIEEDSTLITVPIRKEFVPGVQIQVYLTGKNSRIDERTGRPNIAAPPRPAFANGSLYLSVPPSRETLEVKVIPDKKIMKPGESGEITIEINSPKGSEEEGKEFDGSGTAISLIIVDEAVLSLTAYTLPHPISSFIPSNSYYQSSMMFRRNVVMKDWSSIVVEAPPVIMDTSLFMKDGKGGRGMGGGGGGGGMNNCFFGCMGGESMDCFASCCPCCSCEETKCSYEDSFGTLDERNTEEEVEGEEETTAIEVRSDFRPLAVFVSDAVTNKDGKAIIPFTLPDNLTNYRVWVLAHHEKHTNSFGLGESSIQAQLPVAIRPSIPRFLNYGDRADFTVVVQNQTLDTVHVKLAVRMTNLRLTDEKMKGVLVSIPYAQRAELRFPVKTHRCGTGRFQVIGAVSGTSFADAVEKEIPIFTPSTSEAFATYGEVDSNGVVIQSVIAPESVYNQFGGLTITTSSTALQSLTDSFLYLYNYQFDCVEQISSRMLSINALQKFLYEFNVPKIPTKREIRQVMESGFKKIRGTQRNDGSMGFWSLSSRVNIYLSIYVAHNLIRCLENGYEPDSTLLNRSKMFCQNVDRYISQYAEWYGEFTKASLRAFALYVLSVFGLNKQLSGHEMDKLSKRAESLYKEKKEYFSHEGKVWLMFCLFVCSREKEQHSIVKEILKWIMQNVNETPETANFITSYGDDGKLVMLHSNRRTDGIILEVLCYVDPKNYLIPKIVKGLLAHRKKGRWNSTQENVYILMALKKYFEVFENVVPDFLCRVWLGEGYAGEVKFKGREIDFKQIDIPMKSLVPNEEVIEKKDLTIWKQGEGRLYYRIGMDYAPKSHDLKPIDYGFIVERTYEGVTKKEHVKKLGNGVWEFKAGELVRVKLRLTNVSRRYHVALVGFIPAACEVLNPELKGTEKVPSNATKSSSNRYSQSPYVWSWWRNYYPWYEHVNLRDERVEAFSSYLYCGTHEYEYVMRATTFGEFVVPPAKAEEMYSPEIFGRSSSEKVVIRE